MGSFKKKKKKSKAHTTLPMRFAQNASTPFFLE
jgi:hypothetical protein